MKQIEGFDLITEAGEFKVLPAGAYACKIIEVTDVPEKEYLAVYFDIAEGEYKDYFTTLFKATGKNYGLITRSYKQNALPFFKAFIVAMEKSNPGYKWDWNEKGLSGKLCAISFREEEYENNGEVRVNTKPEEVRSIQALREGKIQIKPRKLLERVAGEAVAPSTPKPPVDIDDEDLPF